MAGLRAVLTVGLSAAGLVEKRVDHLAVHSAVLKAATKVAPTADCWVALSAPRKAGSTVDSKAA
jgi:hypothetical protein